MAATGQCATYRRNGSAPPARRRGCPLTSSPDPDDRRAAGPADDLPPVLQSMWRVVKLGYRNDPGLLVAAFVLSLLAAVPDALLALWLKLLGEGVLQHDRGLLVGAAIGLAVSSTATWFLRT